ncbi:type I toxin-antitoxin system Hok family toxin [Escherichia coli]|nr:type I toxin-antitoxin system Hok family toxin [Escherichia coli]
MLTKYALVAVIVLCLTVLGFTLLVGDSLCEFTVKERNIEFKAVLAYEPKEVAVVRGAIPAYPVVRSEW